MSIGELEQPRQRRLSSLSLRISAGLVFAAVVPLVIVLAFITLQTRPALINQANNAMESDAKSRVQLIDTYFRERVLDAETLTQVTSVQTFMAMPYAPTTAAYKDAALHASYALLAGAFRDKNYSNWSLFDPTGQVRLYNPNLPQKHGQYVIPPDYLTAVTQGKTFISEVYYSPDTKKASVDIYSPVATPQIPGAPKNPVLLGFLRATLNLDYIWNNVVQTDLGNNGQGSYAFILDENGVRIADTDSTRLFTSVEELNADVKQRISQQKQYGSDAAPQVLADSKMADLIHNNTQSAIFQAQPAGQNEPFQIVQKTSSVMPWRYVVLSPVNTVTAVANDQVLSTALLAFAASLFVAIIGLFVGRGITRPILRSVEYLRDNSQSLTTLATAQQDAASEQMWVVDSSQVGMQSVQYYTEAIKVASRRLSHTALEITQHWERADAQQIKQSVERIIAASKYIENAADYQGGSNEKLATALKVATQVTEQLVSGATSATDAATQLEQVVKQLRSVVGR